VKKDKTGKKVSVLELRGGFKGYLKEVDKETDGYATNRRVIPAQVAHEKENMHKGEKR